MTNRNVKLKNRSGDYLYPYTDNIPTASTSVAGKVKLDSSPTSGSNNGITSGAIYTALSSKADNNNVVHLSGNETISGKKTINGTTFEVINNNQFKLLTYDTRVERGTVSESWLGMFPYLLIDKNGKRLSGLYCSYATNMNNEIQLIAYKGTSTNTSDFSITGLAVGYNSNETGYIRAKNQNIPSSHNINTSSDFVATVGWVNSTVNNVVHKSGKETIDGDKTFLQNLRISISTLNYAAYRIQNNAITKGTTPISNAGGSFTVQDSSSMSAEGRLGGFETRYNSDGSIATYMQTFAPIPNSTEREEISLIYPLNGSPYTSAPTPPLDSNGRNIATTNWVNAKFQVVSELPANPNTNVFYFIPE